MFVGVVTMIAQFLIFVIICHIVLSSNSSKTLLFVDMRMIMNMILFQLAMLAWRHLSSTMLW